MLNMTRKIYTFCNTGHSPQLEYHVMNHSILAVDDEGNIVGQWISSNHSYGKQDILRSLTKIEYPYETEWVENINAHPISKIIEARLTGKV